MEKAQQSRSTQRAVTSFRPTKKGGCFGIRLFFVFVFHGGDSQSLLGGVFGGVGHAFINIAFTGTWTPGRMVVSSLTNEVSAAISEGDFGRAVLAFSARF